MLEIRDLKNTQILFGFVEDYQPSQAEKMSRLELFALFGIQSKAHLEDFNQFATGIATDSDFRKEYEAAYQLIIRLSASEHTRRPIRKANFVMEGIRLPSTELVIYSVDQLALVFGMKVPVTDISKGEFANECLAVAADSSKALLLANRVLDSVANYARTYLQSV